MIADNIYKKTRCFEFDSCIYTCNVSELCKMTINVEEKIYKDDKDNPHVYYIDYSYEFIAKNGRTKKTKVSYKHQCCPFYKFENAEYHFNGTFVYKNDMIEKMVEYLLMPFDDIKRYSGTTCPKEYKKQIIQSIALFGVKM